MRMLSEMALYGQSRRGVPASCAGWLLVEGESEYWLLLEMARLCGYEFDCRSRKSYPW